MKTPVGNKTANLRKLEGFGFRVPKFISLSAGIPPEMLQRILETEFSGVALFAVRSSCFEEDGAGTSKAGQFYSRIAVKPEEIYAEMQQVVKSYGQAKGDILLQEFVPGTKSGVLFTNDGEGRMVINANSGLCKPVVEGQPCDEYVIGRKGILVSRQIPVTKKVLNYREGKLEISTTEEESLNARELKQLYKIGGEVAKKMGSPQDIEWSFVGRRLYLLQTRPITRTLPAATRWIHYDSANIAESYSGIVLPLTLSFARHIYGRVYENLLHASGVSRKRLRRHPDIFENMVADFYGRLYYNMNNWYRMMAFIPGYKRNKDNLENMITSNIRLEIERDILPPFHFKLAYPLWVLLKLAVFNQSQHAFRRLLTRYIRDFRSRDLKDYSLSECQALFSEFDERLISRWHVPVENDFLVMTYFGLLKKRMKSERDLQTAIRFKSKTSEQIERIKSLSENLCRVPGMKASLIAGDRDSFKNLWATDPGIKTQLDDYFLEFGGRYANELKLESADIEEDPDRLFEMLSLYSNQVSRTEEPVNDQSSFSLTDRYLIRRFRKYAAAREEMRLLRSNGFSMMRRLMNRVGQILAEQKCIESAGDIYYLRLDEIFQQEGDRRSLIAGRKKDYETFRRLSPPGFFSLPEGEMPAAAEPSFRPEKVLHGRACSAGIIRGKVKLFREFHFPESIDFDIVVTRHTDPGWTPLLGTVRGLIVEHGGILSHAAIVSRELKLPTVIGIENCMLHLQDGMHVELNGNTGTITILDGDKDRSL